MGVLLVASLCLLLIGNVPNAPSVSIDLLGVAWNHDNLTVRITVQDGLDLSYWNEAATALHDWSNVLKSRSGNSSSFNFILIDNENRAINVSDITITIAITMGKDAPVGLTALGATEVVTEVVMVERVVVSESIGQVNIHMAAAHFETSFLTGKTTFTKLVREGIRNIARHELGHAIGLGHTNSTNIRSDLMAPRFVDVDYDVFPSNLDIEAVLHIYGQDGFGGSNLSQIPSSYSLRDPINDIKIGILTWNILVCTRSKF